MYISNPEEVESSMHRSPSINPQIKKILVPHDGSKMSDKALRYAIYLSKLTRADLLILNVMDQPNILIPASAIVFSSPGDKLDKIKNDLQRLSKEYSNQILEKAMELTKQEEVINTSYIVRSGKTVDEIVAVSEKRNIDLIVMASSRIASTIRILGSTTKGVLNSIRKPVLVIHE
ncbi:MAG TPA: universal stress protein [Nitrososphaeraceae archaeon]|nr:universal stress protein [Nitrososphaeraceae archaeon]